MEDQASWKGHTFTLFVFTGIVVLSSIFFILGMLVGRAQGQKLAAAGAASALLKTDARPASKEDDPSSLSFYDALKDAPALQSQSLAKPEPQPGPEIPLKKVAPVPESPPAAAPAGNAVTYQIGALKKSADAEKLVRDVKKKGFRSAFILSPPAGEGNPFFRVQVGPFSDPSEAQDVKKRLESAGYRPIVKK